MLYDKPLSQIIAEDALAALPETFSSTDITEWILAKYPKFSHRTIRSYLIAMSANDRNKRHHSPTRPNVLFKTRDGLYTRYDPEQHGIFDNQGEPLGTEDTDSDDSAEEDGQDSSEDVTFPLERHLEEFIDLNWDQIAFGRPLRRFADGQGNSGRQFRTDIGVIDFLCEDNSSGELVVIELKKGRSGDKVLGQCQRYMGWVQEKLAKPGQNVRGLIIAPEQDDRLRYALKVAPNVAMLCYRIDFQLVDPDQEQRHD